MQVWEYVAQGIQKADNGLKLVSINSTSSFAAGHISEIDLLACTDSHNKVSEKHCCMESQTQYYTPSIPQRGDRPVSRL